MVKAQECVLISPGLPGPGTHAVDPEVTTQVWRVTFDDDSISEIRISPTESVLHKGKIKEMVTELAELVRADGHRFPYSTNNLSATLPHLRR